MSIWLLRVLVVALVWSRPVGAWSVEDLVQSPDSVSATEGSQGPAEPPAEIPAVEIPTDGPDPEPTVPGPPPPPDPSEMTFAISEFQVEGNTILSPEQVKAVLDRHIGPSQRVKDVDDARAALESIYRDAGYPAVLVAVPEQTIENGIVKLTVIESKIAEMSVTGNRHISTQRLLDKVPSLRPGMILHEPTVLADLDTLNATPDRQVVPVLTVGQEPGTVNLELKVRDRLPLHGSVEWNNRGTPSTPEQRLSAAVRYTDLFAREHTLALQTFQSPQDWGAVQVYSASYVVPLETGRTFIAYLAVSDSESAVDGSAINIGGDVAIGGNATIGGVRYTVEMDPAHQLTVGLDLKHLRESQAEFPFPGGTITQVVSSPVSYSPVSLAYTGSVQDDEQATRWSLSIIENISWLLPEGGKENFGGDPETLVDSDLTNDVPGNRTGATGTFFVIKAHGTHVRQLDDGFSLSLTLDGQVASEPLISAEQFFGGGVESVRGYIENEAQGDHGIRGSVEVNTPYWRIRGSKPWLSGSLQGALFVDAAGLQVKDPEPDEKNHHTLVGLGVGVRARLVQGVQARIDQAWALADGPTTRKGDTRGHFSILVEF